MRNTGRTKGAQLAPLMAMELESSGVHRDSPPAFSSGLVLTLPADHQTPHQLGLYDLAGVEGLTVAGHQLHDDPTVHRLSQRMPNQYCYVNLTVGQRCPRFPRWCECRSRKQRSTAIDFLQSSFQVTPSCASSESVGDQLTNVSSKEGAGPSS